MSDTNHLAELLAALPIQPAHKPGERERGEEDGYEGRARAERGRLYSAGYADGQEERQARLEVDANRPFKGSGVAEAARRRQLLRAIQNKAAIRETATAAKQEAS